MSQIISLLGRTLFVGICFLERFLFSMNFSFEASSCWFWWASKRPLSIAVSRAFISCNKVELEGVNGVYASSSSCLFNDFVFFCTSLFVEGVCVIELVYWLPGGVGVFSWIVKCPSTSSGLYGTRSVALNPFLIIHRECLSSSIWIGFKKVKFIHIWLKSCRIRFWARFLYTF